MLNGSFGLPLTKGRGELKGRVLQIARQDQESALALAVRLSGPLRAGVTLFCLVPTLDESGEDSSSPNLSKLEVPNSGRLHR
jgi:hypothetical protein